MKQLMFASVVFHPSVLQHVFFCSGDGKGHVACKKSASATFVFFCSPFGNLALPEVIPGIIGPFN